MAKRILSLILSLALLVMCMPAYALTGLFGDQDLSAGGSVYGLFANTQPYQRIANEDGSVSYIYVNVRPESYISYGNDLQARGFSVVSSESAGSSIKTVVANENAAYTLVYNPAMSELIVTEASVQAEDDDENAIKDVGYMNPFDPEKVIELENGRKLISNEVLLYAETGTTREEILHLAEMLSAEITGEIAVLDLYKLSFNNIFSPEELKAIISSLNELEIVDEAYLNFSEDVVPSAVPNDPALGSWDNSPSGKNWGLEAIHAPEAWEYADNLSITKVGVIDSALYYQHEDLQINKNRTSFPVSKDFRSLDDLWAYYEESDGTHAPDCPLKSGGDCTYCSMKDHASHVSGIIGAVANNNKGIAGVNWFSDVYWTQLWHINKDTSASYPQLTGQSSPSDTIHNITKLVESGCRVINMSYGHSSSSDPDDYEAYVISFFDKGIEKLALKGRDFLLVKSAGNNDEDSGNFASTRYLTNGSFTGPRTLVVGSIQNFAIKWGSSRMYWKSSFSNYGDSVDIFAPGSSIYSTIHDNEYANFSGTSMAAPMVAGAASYLYSLNPELTYDEVIELLISSATDTCVHDFKSYPVLNLGNAVKKLLNEEDILPPAEPAEYGYLEGAVVDAETDELIPRGTVTIVDNETGVIYSTSFTNGVYNYPLPKGEYTLTFSADNYISATIHNVTVNHGLVQHNVRLHMVVVSDEISTINGKIINALTGNGVANATISIYQGIQVSPENAAACKQVTSDSSGKYSVTLEPGNYTAHITANGYHPGSASVLAIGGKTMNEQNVTITPIMTSNEIRIILTWGEYPNDLDSHAYGKVGSTTLHSYYKYPDAVISSTKYINLDLDDTTSYGPETTTIYKPNDSDYSFYVHDYTNRNSSSSVQMSKSNATVTVYLDGSEPLVFNVPNQEGTVWHVFNYSAGTLTPVNNMYYHSDPSSVNRSN